MITQDTLNSKEPEAGYCQSLVQYARRKTNTVNVGGLLIGSSHPIRPQSMTTTDTMDTMGSVEQIIRMVQAGCELVRLTAPSINEANNLANIKSELKKRGIHVPLVADIHFTPNAAEAAARIVEKVRINPGNFVDKKKFQTLEYTDGEYAEEIDRIRGKFIPLLNICKEYGTALRIGTNHGSLSDRIMSRYGDTPIGMVESAMEFLRICEDEGFKNVVLSMKSSNPKVMVEAYRLLVKVMNGSNMLYPLHLGVTEAGDGDDGRIKSALGIGSLLEDGIGDTVRVSLTEDPEFEVPVANKLIARYGLRSAHEPVPFPVVKPNWNPFEFIKRQTREIHNIGSAQVPRVVADLSYITSITEGDLAPFGHMFDAAADKWTMKDMGCDYVYRGSNTTSFMLPMGVKGIYDAATWNNLADKTNQFPLFTCVGFLNTTVLSRTLNFVKLTTTELSNKMIERLREDIPVVLMLEPTSENVVADLRNSFLRLQGALLNNPVILCRRSDIKDEETFMLFSSTDTGSLLTDGFGDGIMLSDVNIAPERVNQISFGILQAARARITKTEYISCPSCGRTLFDLQETTALIRKHTDHLKGVKIAIMGCIVNGPGEMADADYGYVGSGPGKITLYRGRDIVKKGVNKETAVDELIRIIREDGNWIEQGAP